jgi:hypothetical protein
MAITAGEVRAAFDGAHAFIAALERILTGAGTLADAESVAEDVLSAAMIADRATAVSQ